MVVSLNSRLESNYEGEKEGPHRAHVGNFVPSEQSQDELSSNMCDVNENRLAGGIMALIKID